MFAYLFPLIAAASWGFVYALNELVLEEFSPLQLLFICAAVELAVLPFLLLFRGETLLPTFSGTVPSTKIIVVMLGIIALSLVANFCILKSVSSLGSTTAAFLEISYPVFTCVAVYFLYQKSLDLSFFCGAALVVLGVLLIMSQGKTDGVSDLHHSAESARSVPESTA